MTCGSGFLFASIRRIARTDERVSRPVSSSTIFSRGMPDSINKWAMTEASEGPWRPIPPVGKKHAPGWFLAQAKAASTRCRRAGLGCPPGRTAAPKMRIVVIREFHVRLPMENNLEAGIMPRSCAARLWVSG